MARLQLLRVSKRAIRLRRSTTRRISIANYTFDRLHQTIHVLSEKIQIGDGRQSDLSCVAFPRKIVKHSVAVPAREWRSCRFGFGQSGAMSNQENEDREVRERIASLIQATEGSRVTVTNEELQTLTAAASRLDQMLKAAADADVQALKNAAARLDQLLSKIGTGKDVSTDLKRRGDGEGTDKSGEL